MTHKSTPPTRRWLRTPSIAAFLLITEHWAHGLGALPAQEGCELMTVVCTCLYRLLPTLKPASAEMIRRVDLQEEPRQQVAADPGLTVHNVTGRLHRARQALKRALLRWCTPCPEHGFLRCACDLPLRAADAAGQAESQPP